MNRELELVRVAIELGAWHTGGPPSSDERDLATSARSVEPPDACSVTSIAAEIRAGGDPLGERFYQLRDQPTRRDLGAFYTPPQIVAPMVGWLLRQGVDRIVDAGCGSGRFSAAALRVDPNTELVAVDIDPLATLLTRATLSVLKARRASVLQADYMSLCWAALAPAGASLGFIGNPPYVRHHQLTPEAKAQARSMAQELGAPFSALAGLHVYF